MSRSRRTSLSALAGAALIVCAWFAGSARAQSLPRPALHWTRAADASSCIDPERLALRVTALTGPVLVAASAADLSIEGHVQRSPSGGFRARITATARGGKQRGERTLEQDGDDCRALDPALAFVIALLIDPDLALQQLPAALIALGAEGRAPEAVLLQELETQPARPAPPPPAPAQRVSRPQAAAPKSNAPRYRLAAGPALAVGELPRAALGLLVNAALTPRAWLALELALRANFMAGTSELKGGTVRAQSYAGSVLLCPRYPLPALALDLCLGPELGLVHARGERFTRDRSGSALTSGVRLGAGLAVPLPSSWFLQLRALGRLLLRAPHFTYAALDGAHRAFSIKPLSASLELTAGRTF